MIEALFSIYLPSYPKTLVYMLQNTEYQIGPYLKWYWRTQNFQNVMVRRKLEKTKAAKLLLFGLWFGIIVEILLGVTLIILDLNHTIAGGVAFGAALIVGYPVVMAHLVAIPLWLGRVVIVQPKEDELIKESKKIFKKFKGNKIAVVGSYGKTSMKELLSTILGAGKKVAATPGNKNVSISHALFAKKLSGDEDILIIEYGEGKPGDVARFADITQPTHAVITGVAPAHLDHYKTLNDAGADIFSVADYLGDKNVYVNAESPSAAAFFKPNYVEYSETGAMGWSVGDVRVSLTGTSFSLSKAKRKLKLHTKLVGRHHLGPMSLAAALADNFGLSAEQIETAVAETRPYEHRMNPYKLNGAWVIDDTYNGNIEGIRAGTRLLKELKAPRKWYVAPGLVDQGVETKAVHQEMGRLIADAQPNIVVLMKNSVTNYIVDGLKENNFGGEIRIEVSPLDFYNNLGEFVAQGDVVMMQNDWTDNYA